MMKKRILALLLSATLLLSLTAPAALAGEDEMEDTTIETTVEQTVGEEDTTPPETTESEGESDESDGTEGEQTPSEGEQTGATDPVCPGDDTCTIEGCQNHTTPPTTTVCETCGEDPCTCSVCEDCGEDPCVCETEPVITEIECKGTLLEGATIYKAVGNETGLELNKAYSVSVEQMIETADGTVWYKFSFDSFWPGLFELFTGYSYVKEDDIELDEEDSECTCGAEDDEHKKGCPLYVEQVADLPEFPECDCSGGDLAGHDEECAYASYVIEEYFGKVTTRDIYAHWESFDESIQNGILTMLESVCPNDLQELQTMINGEANEVATIVDGMTIIAVGAIPEGVRMAVETIDAGDFGFASALFSYDISFTDEDGAEWQPSGNTVKVTVDAAELGISNGTYVRVFHISDDGSQESVGRYMVSGGKMTFEASSFSGYVGTDDGTASTSVSTTDAPITINLFDYGSLVNQSSTRAEAAVGMGGAGANVFDYNLGDDTKATVVSITKSGDYAGIQNMGTYPVLQNGYPAAPTASGTISLKYLFDKDLVASTKLPYQQTLMEKDGSYYSNYDVLRYPVNNGSLFSEVDGYYEFDSRDNHVWYSTDNDGTIHKESYAVNPEYLNDTRYSGIGHFLPFNGPITQYDLTEGTGDAYEMKKDGNWEKDSYKSHAVSDQNYTVDAENFVNTQASTLYAIRKGAKISTQNRTNMWIGMSVEFDFFQPQGGLKDDKDMIFEFSGDDNMWVYIDDVMILDVSKSGVQDRNKGGAKTATINFRTGEVIVYKVDSSIIDIKSCDTNNNGFFDESECNDTFNYHVAYHTTLRKLFEAAKNGGYIDKIPEFKGETFADFETLSFKMFYMDSGHGTSNCSLKFNMDPLPAGSLSVKKVETELNAEFCGETEYEFELWKKSDGQADFVYANGATYTVIGEGENGSTVYTIGADGKFKLRGNQTASFTSGITVKDCLIVKEISTSNDYTTTYSVDGTPGEGKQTNAFEITDPDKTYDVVFTNEWETADLTVTKVVQGKNDPNATYNVLVKIGDVQFPLSFTNNGSTMKTTIENVPVGMDYTIAEADPSVEADPTKGTDAYHYQNPKFKIGDKTTEVSFIDRTVDDETDAVTWGTVVLSGDNVNAVSGKIGTGTNEVTVTNRCRVDLKISKTGADPLDEYQSFIFDVKDSNGNVVSRVVVHGNGSVVLKDLPVDTYTVVEAMDWSWRYGKTTYENGAFDDDLTSQEATKTSGATVNLAENGNMQVLVTNIRTDDQWLDGNSYSKNVFGDTWMIETPTTITTKTGTVPKDEED